MKDIEKFSKKRDYTFAANNHKIKISKINLY